VRWTSLQLGRSWLDVMRNVRSLATCFVKGKELGRTRGQGSDFRNGISTYLIGEDSFKV
jgi:hypothetical protein